MCVFPSRSYGGAPDAVELGDRRTLSPRVRVNSVSAITGGRHRPARPPLASPGPGRLGVTHRVAIWFKSRTWRDGPRLESVAHLPGDCCHPEVLPFDLGHTDRVTIAAVQRIEPDDIHSPKDDPGGSD